ncbi:Alpha/Beta hydrolase protein [Mycena crocata]|nr:Alpha/Beta hydrolase protein [Mycena crocata]
MNLQTTPFVFHCPSNAYNPPGRVLKMTVNRYCVGDSASNEEGFSLLFAHCIGAHKEQWEPIIAQIFRMQQTKPLHQRVREAWSFDWQNHGDAAVLNRELLASSRAGGVSAFEWAEAIAAFVRSPRMQGKRMVAIGHSAGAGAILLSSKDVPIPVLPYAAFVLVEPTVATRAMFERHILDSQPAVVAATTMRRARWRSRAEAAAWLAQRRPWRGWDAQVLRIYVDSGLEDTPDGGVALKCDRRQEASAFPDVEPHFAAVDELARVCRAVPVHLVWATRSDLVPRRVQDSLSDASAGRVVASITRVEGGHMARFSLQFPHLLELVQEAPNHITAAICSALDAVRVRAVSGVGRGFGFGGDFGHSAPRVRSRL